LLITLTPWWYVKIGGLLKAWSLTGRPFTGERTCVPDTPEPLSASGTLKHVVAKVSGVSSRIRNQKNYDFAQM